MPTRLRKKKDLNETAFDLVQQVTVQNQIATLPVKNPAAVALGKLGGSKGGKARAANLSPQRRKAIARRAANARWGKKS
jgi:hypothetical protein